VIFVVKVQNDGNVADVFRLHGMSTNNNFKIKYLKGASGTTDITTAVVNGTYTTASIAIGSAVTVRVKVTIKSTARLYSSIVARLRTVSTTSPTPSEDKDTVLPIVTAE
jgi:tRNA pseudouridine-54 N-methylase